MDARAIAELLQRCQAGDKAAWNTLVDAYWQRLFGYALPCIQKVDMTSRCRGKLCDSGTHGTGAHHTDGDDATHARAHAAGRFSRNAANPSLASSFARTRAIVPAVSSRTCASMAPPN